jgi:polyhydroxyalkanoate synthase subunit PhaC
VSLLGYCFSGLLTSLYAARHPDAPVRALTNIATPVDFSRWGLWTKAFARFDIDAVLDDTGNIPARSIRQAFRILRPTSDVEVYAAWVENAWSDDYVVRHRTMTRWANDHVPFPGGVAREAVDIVRRNALMNDTVRLGGERVTLRDVRPPHLTVVATRDHLIPEPVAAPLAGLVGSAASDLLRLDAGHVGLVLGRSAAKNTIPAIIEFMRRRSEPITKREQREERWSA